MIPIDVTCPRLTAIESLTTAGFFSKLLTRSLGACPPGGAAASVVAADHAACASPRKIRAIARPDARTLLVEQFLRSHPDNLAVSLDDDGIAEGLVTKQGITHALPERGVDELPLLEETQCRVTRVSDAKHLRASHIKPWRDANNAERLNGQNGLLLSPHVDHLFDQGYITFSNSEQLLVVPDVRSNLLSKWGIDAGTRVGEFTREQQAFLDYHRVHVFKGAGG